MPYTRVLACSEVRAGVLLHDKGAVMLAHLSFPRRRGGAEAQ